MEQRRNRQRVWANYRYINNPAIAASSGDRPLIQSLPEQKNMRSMIGEQIADNNKKILGKITDQYQEDGEWWAIIDDSYGVRIDGCTHHLDIFGYERAANPKLEASFVKLSILG